MLRTIKFFTAFGLSLLFVMFLLIPVILLLIINQKESVKHFTQKVVNKWAYFMLWVANVKFTVSGLENLPSENNFCIISNHQGNFDILGILAKIPVLPGFIAKKELSYVPVFSSWMKVMRCVFIDRNDRVAALHAINHRLEMVKDGFPMLIFPEGTRSRRNEMKPFKHGGVVTIASSGVDILPISISNSYRCFEETGNITPTKAHIHIHPILKTDNLSDFEVEKICGRLELIIKSEIMLLSEELPQKQSFSWAVFKRKYFEREN
jgi:1-acyl-sn-glycerol-3-phosphate acyltransferase